jgi:hypothetical protein
MTNQTQTIEAKFDIDSWDEEPYDEPAEGPKLTRIMIEKTYRGAIEGSGVAKVLTAQGEGGSAYTASERVVGTLDGRRGSFVIQHGGIADGEEMSSFGTIVPGSGTGDLAGISGTAKEVSHGVLTLEVGGLG